MKKYIISIVLIFLFPIITFAWNSKTSDKDILQEFNKYSQPKKLTGVLYQWNMSAKYTANKKTLTDIITIKIWNSTRIIKWPWAQASKDKRKSALQMWGDYNVWGFYDYSILKLSPSGNYIELIGYGYEGWIWRMLDTRTWKIIFSDKVVKSMWSNDRKQFIFQTCTPENITNPESCNENLKTFITINWKFPKYKQIN